jgi:SAM-dependent methyltransferase
MQTEEYDRLRAAEDTYWWFVSRRALAFRLLRMHAAGRRPVLDAGCGTGAFLAMLGDAEAVGLDSSPLALAYTVGRGVARAVLGDAQRLPFRPGAFGAAVSLDTLEHLPDDRAAVRELLRCLEPGGVLVANVPAYRWLWGPHDVALHHCRRYTRGQVRRLLHEAGFEVVLCNYSVFFLFPLVVVTRVADRFRRGEPSVRLPRVPGWANRFLVGLMAAESWLLCRVPLPWGSSVVAVARKPGGLR